MLAERSTQAQFLHPAVISLSFGVLFALFVTLLFVPAVYAISGVLLIFRTTDFLKYESTHERKLEVGLSGKGLGEQLRMKGFAVVEETADTIRFRQGEYNKQSGEVVYTQKDYPAPLAKSFLPPPPERTGLMPVLWL